MECAEKAFEHGEHFVKGRELDVVVVCEPEGQSWLKLKVSTGVALHKTRNRMAANPLSVGFQYRESSEQIVHTVT